MAENPYVYNGHIELIKVLREAGELDDLRQARQKMSELFPLSEGMLQKHRSRQYGSTGWHRLRIRSENAKNKAQTATNCQTPKPLPVPLEKNLGPQNIHGHYCVPIKLRIFSSQAPNCKIRKISFQEIRMNTIHSDCLIQPYILKRKSFATLTKMLFSSF